MMRSSRLELLRLIARCDVSGYWTRGQNAVYWWLIQRGLIAGINNSIPHYKLTDAGRVELSSLGYCDRCGGHGNFQIPDGLGIKWERCIHPRQRTILLVAIPPLI